MHRITNRYKDAYSLNLKVSSNPCSDIYWIFWGLSETHLMCFMHLQLFPLYSFSHLKRAPHFH